MRKDKLYPAALDSYLEDDGWKENVVFLISSVSALNFIDWGEDRQKDAEQAVKASTARSA